MESDQIISVGIDIGTSTTSMVVSRMTVKNTASCFAVPHVDITDKEIIYRSPIYATPQKNGENLDIFALQRILEAEYRSAGLTPDDVDTGAVIITGESSRKENAALVTDTLSGIAGEFVVATAGPDLESVIAAKGAGAQQLSDRQSCTVANLDIGGGTTNIAVFRCGELVAKGCWDIGGRLLRLDDKAQITYLSPRLAAVAESLGLSLRQGQRVDEETLRALTRRMARLLAEAIGLCPATPLCTALHTGTAARMAVGEPIDRITFSGGVAEAYYNPPDDLLCYRDIGPLLAESLHAETAFSAAQIAVPRETIRATVIGAGSYTTTISGSTIDYSETALFPLKNLPAVLLDEAAEAAARQGDASAMAAALDWAAKQSDTDQLVLCFAHTANPTYAEIGAMAKAILAAHQATVPASPVLVLTRADFAKVLGQAIQRRAPSGTRVLCIDNVWVAEGDYLDLGRPLAGGTAIPVVVKTLLFG